VHFLQRLHEMKAYEADRVRPAFLLLTFKVDLLLITNWVSTLTAVR
jgi:hypothetical protein